MQKMRRQVKTITRNEKSLFSYPVRDIIGDEHDFSAGSEGKCALKVSGSYHDGSVVRIVDSLVVSPTNIINIFLLI